MVNTDSQFLALKYFVQMLLVLAENICFVLNQILNTFRTVTFIFKIKNFWRYTSLYLQKHENEAAGVELQSTFIKDLLLCS